MVGVAENIEKIKLLELKNKELELENKELRTELSAFYKVLDSWGSDIEHGKGDKTMKKYLYRFYIDYGRMGDLEGLFVATEKEVNEAIGKEVYFGEVLGKHSEVGGILEENDIEKINVDSVSVERVAKYLGNNWSGFNPLDYILYYCSNCQDKLSKDEFNITKNICNYCDSND